MNALRSSTDKAAKPAVKRSSYWRRFDLRRDGVRALIALVALLLVNLGVWWTFIKPLNDEITAKAELKEAAAERETAEAQNLDEVRAVHAHVEAVQAGVRRFFDEMLSVRTERWVPFQRALHQVGTEFRVTPQRASIGREQLEQEGIDRAALSFPLEGGYENLRHFLARLEALDQFLIIRSVNLRNAKEGGNALQLDIQVETYFNAPEMREELERERLWKEKQRARGRRSKGRR